MKTRGYTIKCIKCNKIKIDMAFGYCHIRRGRNKICKQCDFHEGSSQNKMRVFDVFKGEPKV